MENSFTFEKDRVRFLICLNYIKTQPFKNKLNSL